MKKKSTRPQIVNAALQWFVESLNSYRMLSNLSTIGKEIFKETQKRRMWIEKSELSILRTSSLIQVTPKIEVLSGFYGLIVRHREHYDHENKCGSITEECPSCKRRVARRDGPFHKCGDSSDPSLANSSTGELKAGGGDYSSYSSPYVSRPKPANEALYACEVCSTPCESFDDLQVHMLTAHYDEQLAVATAASLEDAKPAQPVVEEKKDTTE